MVTLELESLSKLVSRMREISLREPKSLVGRALKLAEECGEVASEVTKLDGKSQKEPDVKHLIEELVDVVQCSFSMLLYIENHPDFSWDEVIALAHSKLDKWEDVIPRYTKYPDIRKEQNEHFTRG